MLGCVIRIDAQNAAGGAVTLRLASLDIPELCHLGGEQWEPALAVLPDFAFDFFGGAFAGQVTTPGTSFAAATSGLAAFSADPAARARFARARCRVWVGDPFSNAAADLGPLALWFDGRISQEPAIDEASRIARFEVDVDAGWADKPLLPLFAGTGGIEGPQELAGQPKPLCLGNVRFARGVLIDSVDNVWMVSAGPVQGISAAYDRLGSLGASSGDHPNLAALLAASIANGSWATCLAQGLVRLGAPPDGRVSFHVQGSNSGAGGYVRRAGAMMRRIADLAGGAVNAASLAALDTARPFNQQLQLSDQTTAREMIARLADSVAAVAGVSLTGELFAQPLGIVNGGETLNADDTSSARILAVEELPKLPPDWRLATEAQPTFEVHSLSEIAFQYRWQGEWSTTRVYRRDDVVTGPDSASWVYINQSPASGQVLPVWPIESNSHWQNFTPPPYDGNLADVEAGANVTETRTAAFIQNQGALATQSTVGWQIVEDRPFSLRNEAFDASGRILANGLVYGMGQTVEALRPAQALADVTGQNTAAFFANQGALATQNTAGWSQVVSRPFALQDTGFDAFGRISGERLSYDPATTIQSLRPAEANANITENRTAAFVAGQSPWATTTIPTARVNNLDNSGNLSSLANVTTRNLNQLNGRAWTNLFLANGSTPVTDAAAVTSLGTAAFIAGQGPLATASQAAWDSQISGRPAFAVDTVIADGTQRIQSNYIRDLAQSSYLSDRWPSEFGANVTENRIAAFVAGQGPLATASSAAWDSQISGRPVFAVDTVIADGTPRVRSVYVRDPAQGSYLSDRWPQEANANRTETRTAAFIAGQAPAATDTTIQVGANRTQAANANRVTFSRMERGFGWVTGFSQMPVTVATRPVTSQGRVFIRTDAAPSDANQSLFVTQTDSARIVVRAGDRLSVSAAIEAQAITGPAPSFWRIFVEFFNGSGGNLGSQEIASGTGNAFNSPRREAFVTAPANAVSMRILTEVRSAGAGTLFCSIEGPMVASALTGQTIHPPYTPGLNAVDGADVTAQNTAAFVAGQGPLATASQAAWDSQISGRPAFAVDTVIADGTPRVRSVYVRDPAQGSYLSDRWPQEANANRTETRTAAFINNQGAFATQSTAGWSQVVSRPFALEDASFDAFGRISGERLSYDPSTTIQSLRPQEANANRTETRTAAFITNQGAFATQSTAGWSQVVSRPFALEDAAFDAFGRISGQRLSYDPSTTIQSLRPAEANANVTETRTAAFITGQSPWATTSQFTPAQVFSPGFNLINDPGLRLRGQGWSLPSGWVVFTSPELGNIAANSSNNANMRVGRRMSISGGQPYVFSMMNGGSGYSATPVFQLNWFTSGGAFISQVTASGRAAGGVARTAVAGTAPANAAFAECFVQAPGGGFYFAYQPKFEPGLVPSLWGENATAGALYSTGDDIDTLRPGELGANVTEIRTAAFIANQGAFATTTLPTSRLNFLNDAGRASSRRLTSQIVAGGVLQTINTNPLTASTDSNTGVSTITINAHSVFDDFGQIDFSAGSIGGLAEATLYYVWEANPDFVGGARSYVATTNRNDLTTFGRRYVGFVTTPVAGNNPVNGGGGGGAGFPGAQPELAP